MLKDEIIKPIRKIMELDHAVQKEKISNIFKNIILLTECESILANILVFTKRNDNDVFQNLNPPIRDIIV